MVPKERKPLYVIVLFSFDLICYFIHLSILYNVCVKKYVYILYIYLYYNSYGYATTLVTISCVERMTKFKTKYYHLDCLAVFRPAELPVRREQPHASRLHGACMLAGI